MTDAPPVRRRVLGAALRRFREQAGCTLDDAARILNCDRSKISRIETGQRGIRATELQGLLAEYGVDELRRDALLTLAHQTRQDGWWQSVWPRSWRCVPGLCRTGRRRHHHLHVRGAAPARAAADRGLRAGYRRGQPGQSRAQTSTRSSSGSASPSSRCSPVITIRSSSGRSSARGPCGRWSAAGTSCGPSSATSSISATASATSAFRCCPSPPGRTPRPAGRSSSSVPRRA